MNEELLKEISKKNVGGYHLKAFAHVEDSGKGAMGIYVINSEKMLHHSGITAKNYAHKLYHGLNTHAKVEDFLKNVMQQSRGVSSGNQGGFINAFKNF